MSLKHFSNGRAQPATRPVSLRLALAHIEQLQARAVIVSGTATGVARELILTGLAGGDNKALADRLMQIERRLVAVESATRDLGHQASRIEQVLRDLATKFDALLSALSVEEDRR